MATLFEQSSDISVNGHAIGLSNRNPAIFHDYAISRNTAISIMPSMEELIADPTFRRSVKETLGHLNLVDIKVRGEDGAVLVKDPHSSNDCYQKVNFSAKTSVRKVSDRTQKAYRRLFGCPFPNCGASPQRVARVNPTPRSHSYYHIPSPKAHPEFFESRFHDLQRENRELRLKIENLELQRQLEKSEQLLRKAVQQLSGAKEEISALQEILAIFQNDLEEKRKAHQKANESLAASVLFNIILAKAFQGIGEENNELKRQLETLQTQYKNLNMHSGAQDVLLQEAQKLTEATSPADLITKIKDLQSALANEKQRSEKLQHSLSQSEERARNLQKKLDAADTELSRLRPENQSLTRDLNKAQQELSEIANAVRGGQPNGETLPQLAKRYHETIGRLERKLDTTLKANQGLQQIIPNTCAELPDASLHDEDLSNAVRALKISQAEAQRASKSLHDELKTLKQQDSQKGALLDRIGVVLDKKEKSHENLPELVNALGGENRQLKEKITNYVAAQVRLGQILEEVGKLTGKRIETAEDLPGAVESALRKVETRTETANRRATSLENSVSALTKELEETQRAHQKEIAAREDEISSLKTRGIHAEAKLLGEEELVIDLESQAEALRRECGKATRALKEAKKQHGKELSVLEDELNSAKNALSQERDTIKTLREEVDDLEQAALDTRLSHQEALQKQETAHEEALRPLREEISALNGDVRSLQHQLDERAAISQQELGSLEEETRRLRALLEAINSFAREVPVNLDTSALKDELAELGINENFESLAEMPQATEYENLPREVQEIFTALLKQIEGLKRNNRAVEELDADITDLQLQLADQKKKATSTQNFLQRKIEQLEEEKSQILEDAKSQIDEKDDLIRRLQDTIAKERSEKEETIQENIKKITKLKTKLRQSEHLRKELLSDFNKQKDVLIRERQLKEGLNGDVDTLTHEKKRLQEAIATMKKTIKELENERDSLQEESGFYSIEHSKLLNQNSALKRELWQQEEAHQSVLEPLRQDVDDLTYRVSEQDIMIAFLTENLQKEANVLADAQHVQKEHLATISSLTESVDNLKHTLAQATEAIELSEGLRLEEQKSHQDLQRELSEDRNRASTQNEELQRKVSVLQQALRTSQEALEEAKSQENSQAREVEKLTESVKLLQHRLDERAAISQDELETLRKETRRLKDLLGAIDSVARKVPANLKASSPANKPPELYLNADSENLSEIPQDFEVEELSSVLDSFVGEIPFNLNASSLANELAELDPNSNWGSLAAIPQTPEHEKLPKEVQDIFNALLKEVEELKRKDRAVKELEDRIEDLMEQQERGIQARSSLQDKINELKLEKDTILEGVQSQVDKENRLIETLRRTLTRERLENEETVREKTDRIEELEQELREAKKAYKILDHQFSKQKKELQEERDYTQQLTEQLENLTAKKEGVEKELVSLQKNLQTMKENRNRWQEEAGFYESHYSELFKQHSTLKIRYRQLEDEISQLRGILAATFNLPEAATLDQFDERQRTLQGRVEDMTVEIDRLTNTVARIETYKRELELQHKEITKERDDALLSAAKEKETNASLNRKLEAHAREAVQLRLENAQLYAANEKNSSCSPY